MRTRTQAVCWLGRLPDSLASACNSGPASPSSSSRSVGQWNGTTAQGRSITFTVSSDESSRRSRWNTASRCSGTQTFSNLNVPDAPDVTCVPGPCSGTQPTYRAFAYSDGRPRNGPSPTINGLFLLATGRRVGVVSRLPRPRNRRWRGMDGDEAMIARGSLPIHQRRVTQ